MGRRPSRRIIGCATRPEAAGQPPGRSRLRFAGRADAPVHSQGSGLLRHLHLGKSTNNASCFLVGIVPEPQEKVHGQVSAALACAALLAVLGACAPKPEPAVTPMAALPEPPPSPMMVPSIPPPPPHAVHSSSKRLSSVKKHHHATEHKVASKNGKHTKVAKYSKKKSHHTKVAKASKRHAPASTKLASRVKPVPVPLDAPPPAPRRCPAPMSTAPATLSPGIR